MINEHASEFGGFSVEDFDPKKGIKRPEKEAYRLRLDWDDSEAGTEFSDVLNRFLADPRAGEVRALVVGNWGEVAAGDGAEEVVEALVSARAKLPRLSALFIGDIVGEESEISWINQTDVSPLWTAFPELESLRLRGGTGLSLGSPRHAKLRSLIIEAGGLPVSVVHQVCKAQLPVLEHLELWLGDDNYGWDGTAADLAPILAGGLFPKLRYLGIRNSQIADDVAKVAANAPILAQLHTLDLSLGNISDEGAQALLASRGVRGLKTLDLHHNYISESVIARMQSLGPAVDASDPQEADEDGDETYRYIAVSE